VQESTFELSLAAEAVAEMLAMHCGRVIAAALPLVAECEAAAAAKAEATEKAEKGKEKGKGGDVKVLPERDATADTYASLAMCLRVRFGCACAGC
jgi:LAIKA domain